MMLCDNAVSITLITQREMSLEDGHKMGLGKERGNQWLSGEGCISSRLQKIRPRKTSVSMTSNQQRLENRTSKIQSWSVTASLTCSARHERGGDHHTGFVIRTVEFYRNLCVCKVEVSHTLFLYT